jgi:hypothetical protein
MKTVIQLAALAVFLTNAIFAWRARRSGRRLYVWAFGWQAVVAALTLLAVTVLG